MSLITDLHLRYLACYQVGVQDVAPLAWMYEGGKGNWSDKGDLAHIDASDTAERHNLTSERRTSDVPDPIGHGGPFTFPFRPDLQSSVCDPACWLGDDRVRADHSGEGIVVGSLSRQGLFALCPAQLSRPGVLGRHPSAYRPLDGCRSVRRTPRPRRRLPLRPRRGGDGLERPAGQARPPARLAGDRRPFRRHGLLQRSGGRRARHHQVRPGQALVRRSAGRWRGLGCSCAGSDHAPSRKARSIQK